QYGLQRDADGLWLYFYAATPGATEYFLVVYTAAHTMTGAATTVPSTDLEAVADLAAAYAVDKLAALSVPPLDGSVSGDVTDRRSRADVYRSIAKDFRALYKTWLGGDEKP